MRVGVRELPGPRRSGSSEPQTGSVPDNSDGEKNTIPYYLITEIIEGRVIFFLN